MANVLVEESTLQNIANSIRAKSGKTEKMIPSAMSGEIDELNIGITPTGTLVITENGTHDVTNYASAKVNVESSGGSGGSSGDLDALIDGSITEVVSNNAASVKRYGFYECTKLTDASFNNAISIGRYAFQNCSNLLNANFPKAETLDGANVFSGCQKLENINLPKLKALGENTFSTCYKLKKVKFPSVELISSNSTFASCTKLEEVDFDSLLAIRSSSYTWQKCYSLKTLILRSPTLCTLGSNNVFTMCHHILGTYDPTYNPNQLKDGYIYVPRALLSDEDETMDYRRATNWSNFASQFRILEDFTIDGTTIGELDPSKI